MAPEPPPGPNAVAAHTIARQTPAVRPSADAFTALARSSPWRWSTLRFTGARPADARAPPVRAWLRRPDLLRVETLGRRAAAGRPRAAAQRRADRRRRHAGAAGAGAVLPLRGRTGWSTVRPDDRGPTTPRCTRTTAGWRCSTRSSSPTGSTGRPARRSRARRRPRPRGRARRPPGLGGRRAARRRRYEPRCGCCPLLRIARGRPAASTRTTSEHVLDGYPGGLPGAARRRDRRLRAHRGARRADAGRGPRPADRGGRRADGRRPVRPSRGGSPVLAAVGAALNSRGRPGRRRRAAPGARPAARCRAGGPAAAQASRAHSGSSAVCPHSGGQSTAASAISSNAARTSSAVTWASPNERMPGVSMTMPPWGRSNSTTDDDVCRPLPILLTSPVARKASGTSRLTRVDLPTPDCPTSTLIRQGSRSSSVVQRRSREIAHGVQAQAGVPVQQRLRAGEVGLGQAEQRLEAAGVGGDQAAVEEAERRLGVGHRR